MDILELILDPQVIMSLLLALFSPYLGKLGKLIVKGFAKAPLTIKKFLRIRKWKRIRAYYLIYSNPHEITWNIARTYFYLTVFIMCMLFYVVFVKLGAFGDIDAFPQEVQHLIFSPIYAFEVLWIKQRSFTRNLIELKNRRRKKRIARR
ncbi:hypothetical protein BCU30_006495 [Vibrio lentus]|uniref:hypothetical protein n=1 Tax=Vibrio lentus TaxID=136468 RepID=UPI000C861C96|nr:hypothetical protein [Vibrio lentus]PMG19087.1 hypothetical protein BCU96_09760 [Vibrio lentus]PMH16506.1 hypothetical protein BCU76_01040 [Vibrio lentus]PMJ12124.1 hypothetical protein BCU30_17755 [Vibrio lentus]PMK94964.1 hypothetical protein BCT89_14410 [Vibrio lentus]PMN17317.1 hypothetical protein BCT39_16215 [Vibrio lentus]